MIWEVITGKTPSPYNPLTVEPSWSVAQLLQGGGSSDHDGALAADKDRRCTATQLKDGLAIARNAEPKPQASDLLTVGADSCDEMLRGLEGLGGSRTIDTVDATPPDTMGTSTVELVRQLSGPRVIPFQNQFRQRLSLSNGGVGRGGLDRRLRCAIVAPHGSTTLPKRLHMPPTRAGVMPQKVLWTR